LIHILLVGKQAFSLQQEPRFGKEKSRILRHVKNGDLCYQTEFVSNITFLGPQLPFHREKVAQ